MTICLIATICVWRGMWNLLELWLGMKDTNKRRKMSFNFNFLRSRRYKKSFAIEWNCMENSHVVELCQFIGR